MGSHDRVDIDRGGATAPPGTVLDLECLTQ